MAKKKTPSHPPITAGGFDRGGFEYFYVGRKKSSAGEIVSALRAQQTLREIATIAEPCIGPTFEEIHRLASTNHQEYGQ